VFNNYEKIHEELSDESHKKGFPPWNREPRRTLLLSGIDVLTYQTTIPALGHLNERR